MTTNTADDHPPRDRAELVVRLVLTVVLGVTGLIALIISAQQSSWAVTATVFIVLALFIEPLIDGLVKRGLPYKWLLSVAVIFVFLVIPEFLLRAAHFRYEARIEFGYPRPSRMRFYEPDADLFWKLPPRDEDVNSLGFMGPEIESPKPADTFRILFLGDSVTHQGFPAYVEQMLNAPGRPHAGKYECINLGVPGYTSHQGAVAARKYGELVDPDLVFVYFGWNDHWLAHSKIDTDRAKVAKAPASGGSGLYHNLRLLQGAAWLMARLSSEGSARLTVPRVPAEHYTQNLEDIRELWAARDVPVVFVTAASSHQHLGVPQYLVDMGFAASSDDVLGLHREYVELSRAAGQGKGARTLDLYEEFDAMQKPSLEGCFMNDGIHFLPPGLGLVAARVVRYIDEEQLGVK